MHLAFLLGLILALPGGSPGTAAIHAPDFYSVSAQSAPTGTVAVTSTTALTPTSIVSATSPVTATTVSTYTPVAIPTQAPPSSGNLRINPFDFGFLTEAPNPPMGPFAWAYLVLMLALLGGSAYFYFYKRPQWKRTNSVLYRAADRWAQIGLWIAILALLFLLFRAISLTYLDIRLWLYLWVLALIAAAAWFFYWYRTTYPKEMEKFNKRQRARQYMPGAAKGAVRPSGPATSKPLPRGSTPKGQPTTASPASPQGTGGAPPTTPSGKNRRRRR